MLLLLLIVTVVSVCSASSSDKCTTVYPTKAETVLPSSTVSLGDNISLKLDEHRLPVLVVGKLIKGDLHIDWLHLSTEDMSFTIHVGVGNSISGDDVLSAYKAKTRVQSEIGHVIVDIPTVDCKYDYIMFKVCTHEHSEDKEACNPTQMIIVEKEIKIDMKIVTKETLEDNVELEFTPDISIEKNKLAYLECVVIQADNQEDKKYEIQYYKKTGLNFVVAHTLNGNSTYTCLLLVSSPNYYQLYSTDLISFDIESVGKGEHKPVNSTEEGKENAKRFIRGMSWGRSPVAQRWIKMLKYLKMTSNRYNRNMKNANRRKFMMKKKHLSQSMKNEVVSLVRKYLRRRGRVIGGTLTSK